MADIGTAYIRIAPNMTGIQGKVASGLRGSGTAAANVFGSEMTGRMAAIMGLVAGIAQAAIGKAMQLVSRSIGDAVSRVDTLNRFPTVMKNLGYSAKDASQQVKRIANSLIGLPTSLDSMTTFVQRIAPMSSSLNEATDVALAFNNAVLAGGGPVYRQADAIEQFSQMLAKGTPDMMAWRTLQEAMPATLSQVAKSLGITSGNTQELYDKLKAGKITFDDFTGAVVSLNKKGLPGFKNFADQAKDATAGIQTGWANMQLAITRGVANIITAIGSDNISAVMSGIGKSFESAMNIIAQQVPKAVSAIKSVVSIIVENKDLFSSLAAGALAAASAFLVFNAAVKIMTSVQAVITGLGVAMSIYTNAVAQGIPKMYAFNAALGVNPILAIVTAIAAVVTALVFFFTQTETGKKLFSQFVSFLGGVWNNIKSGMASVASFFGTVWDSVKSAFSSVLSFIQNNWRTILTVLTGPLGLAIVWIVDNWGKIKQTFIDTKNSIVNTMSTLWSAVRPFIQPFIDVFVDSGKAISEAFNSVKNIIGNIGSSFSGAKSQFDSSFGSIPESIRPIFDSLKTTWDQLKKSWDSVVKAVSPAIESLKTSFTTAWNEIKKAMQPVVEIVKQVGAAFAEFWDQHGEKIMTGLKILGAIFIGAIVAPIAIVVVAVLALAVAIAKVIEWIAKAITWVNNFASAFINIAQPYIEGFAKAVGAVISGIVTHIVNVVKTIIQVFTGIVQILGGIISGIVSIVGGIISGIFTIITSIFSGIIQFFSGWFQIIQGIFTGNWEMVKQGVLTIISGFITIMAGLFNGFVQIFVGIWNGLVAIGTGIWNGLVTIITAIVTGFINNLINTWNSLTTAISAIMTGIWQTIVNIWNIIKGAVMAAINGILTVVVTIFNAIVNAIKWYINLGLTVIRTIFTAIVNFIMSRLRSIQNIFVSTWNYVVGSIRSAWNTISSTVSSGVSRVISFVSSLPGRIRGFFSGAANWLVNAGRSILDGLANGIRQAADVPKKAIEGVMSGIRRLLPSSPAKEGPFSGKGWTLYSGISMMDALASGITRESSNAKNAMSNAMSDVADSALSALSTPLANSSASFGINNPGGLTPGQSGGNTQSVTIQNVNLGSAGAVQEFFRQLNQDTISVGMGLTPKQGAQ